jgi:hypothetical protein
LALLVCLLALLVCLLALLGSEGGIGQGGLIVARGGDFASGTTAAGACRDARPQAPCAGGLRGPRGKSFHVFGGLLVWWGYLCRKHAVGYSSPQVEIDEHRGCLQMCRWSR